METVIHNVGDLDTASRVVLERVVGHQLRESQKLVIQVVSIVVTPPAPPTTTATTRLPDWCRVYRGLSDERIDELDRAIVRLPSSRPSA